MTGSPTTATDLLARTSATPQGVLTKPGSDLIGHLVELSLAIAVTFAKQILLPHN